MHAPLAILHLKRSCCVRQQRCLQDAQCLTHAPMLDRGTAAEADLGTGTEATGTAECAGRPARQAVNAEKSRPLASAMAARKSSHVTACPSWRLKYRSMPFLRGGARASEKLSTRLHACSAAPLQAYSAKTQQTLQKLCTTQRSFKLQACRPLLADRQRARQTCSGCACERQGMKHIGMATFMSSWARLKPSTPSSVWYKRTTSAPFSYTVSV